MALVVKDRVKVTSTTTGTGTFTLGSAVLGFQDFSVIGDGNTTYYTIVGAGSAEFEVGIGTFTASGTTLSRDTILESSNAGNAVNFSAGSKEVFVTYPAERAVYTDAAGTAITPATASTLGVASGGTGAATLTAENVIIGDGTNAVKFVAPGTSGNVLTSNGSVWASAAAPAGGTVIPSGTVMLFAQTAAPTGFTKNTSTGDNHALRIVTGTASSGGSVDFSTAFASQSVTGTVSVTASTGQVAQGGTVSSPASTGQVVQGGTVSVSASVGNTTLSTPQIPAHAHGCDFFFFDSSTPKDFFRGNSNITPVGSRPTNNAGGGGSHNHPISAPASFSGQQHAHPVSVTSTFSGAQHNHPVSSPATFSGSAINLAVKFVDIIRATKD